MGIAKEEPSAEFGREGVERGNSLWKLVDARGDRDRRIEHGVEIGDCVLRLIEGVDDGIEDKLATTTGNEPVMGKCDPVGGGGICCFVGLMHGVYDRCRGYAMGLEKCFDRSING